MSFMFYWKIFSLEERAILLMLLPLTVSWFKKMSKKLSEDLNIFKKTRGHTQGDQKIGRKFAQKFGKSSPNSCQTKYCDNVFIKSSI